MFYDEFSVSEQNSTYYGWARRNSRPKVKSNEATRRRVNGLLSIDVLTGQEYLWLCSHAQSDDVARYFAHLAKDSFQEGYQSMEVLLDRNTTHQQQMQQLFRQEANKLGLEDFPVTFRFLPAYSPKLNLAEYAIHLLRLRCLHHRPYGMKLEAIIERLQQQLAQRPLLTDCQITNILQYIEDLVKIENTPVFNYSILTG